MTLSELTLIGGTLYLNIVHADTTDTLTLPATEAVEKYGHLQVIDHQPYQPTDGTDGGSVSGDTTAATKGRKRKAQVSPAPAPGTDIVVLQG